MAFINQYGQNISFDCSDVIEELKADISEFGEDLPVYVIIEEMEGVTIYKDYLFVDDEGVTVELMPGEQVIQMPAGKLLTFYELENKIL